MIGRRSLVAAGLAATALPAWAQARDGAHDFDFLAGRWRVHHRRIRPDTGAWVEFDGTCETRLLMDGRANVEEHWMPSPTGTYRAVGLRAYDGKMGLWSIWWLDGRVPARPLDPPARGRFEDGVGSFYADYEQDGKAMRGRLQWSQAATTSPRWEQAVSADVGQTWSPNWIMQWRRA